MGDKSAIEWTDATWTPIRAKNVAKGKVGWHCEHVSPGCVNCYAEAMNKRLGNHLPFKPGHRGDIRMILDDNLLVQPLKWKKPRTVFVCSMTDLFGDFVPEEWIDRMFAVMALCPQHTFQILTKRSSLMREYMLEKWQPTKAQTWKFSIRDQVELPAATEGEDRHSKVDEACEEIFNLMPALSDTENPDLWDENDSLKSRHFSWPLPNVWLGVSCEDQARADERIPDLLETPAAVRFVSAEPLLGPIDFLPYLFIVTHEDDAILACPQGHDDPLPFHDPATTPLEDIASPRLDWIIAGGENGRDARPMHPDWVRGIRDQCATAGTAFFFKQWGEWLPGEANFGQFDPKPMHGYRRCDNHDYVWPPCRDVQNFGSHADRWSGNVTTRKVGKKRAGRHLDGIEHNGYPDVSGEARRA